MTEHVQQLPVRVYRTSDLLMLVAPMPGLEPDNISVSVAGDRVIIHGEERGPHQHNLDLLVAEWTIGPYHREVELPHPVDGRRTNATYGNGVLVLSMPALPQGHAPTAEEIRLQVIEATRGERVGWTGREARTTEREGLRRAG